MTIKWTLLILINFILSSCLTGALIGGGAAALTAVVIDKAKKNEKSEQKRPPKNVASKLAPIKAASTTKMTRYDERRTGIFITLTENYGAGEKVVNRCAVKALSMMAWWDGERSIYPKQIKENVFQGYGEDVIKKAYVYNSQHDCQQNW